MQIFVFGMHRSGTSAVARVLNLMGCYFGGEDIGTEANEENTKGFWERKDVRKVNDAILRNTGSDWDRISSFDVRSIGKGDMAVYREVIRKIVVNLDAHRPWFLKEPRFCLTFSVWRSVLEMPVCVLIFRNPLDVAKSLNERNGMPLTVGLALWEAYNAGALEASRGINRIVLSYEALMSNSSVAVGKLLEALGQEGYVLRRPAKRELVAFLDDELRHHRTGSADVRGAVSEAQIALFDQLREAEQSGNVGALPSLDGASTETLAQYETTLPSVSLRAKDANASLLRRQQVGVTTELALRRLELDGALQSLQETRSELRKWRNEHDRVKTRNVSLLADGSAMRREIWSLSSELAQLRRKHEGIVREMGAFEETLRRKDRDLVAATQELGSLRKELKDSRGSLEAARKQAEAARELGEGLQATLERKDRDLTLATAEFHKLSLERGRLESGARRNATRVAELESLVDATMEDVALLLGSRRWRVGDGLLSAPHRLLGRGRPATVADHLRQLQRMPRRTAGSPRAVSPAAELPSPSKGSGPSSAEVTPRQRKQVTVLVLAWDVGHNPLGRAYLLAEALARSYTVVLAGFQFPRYGETVWKPLRDSAFRTVSIPGRSFPEFQRTLETLARRIDADVVVACKARLPTVQAGLMFKALRNRPLLVDVDDYELSFFPNRKPLNDLSTQAADALAEPYEEAWTRYTENLLPFADSLLVSNPELQRRFGGVVVPHARDETVFRPELVDRKAARRALGLGTDQKVVMFVGTPRPHKGVLEILDAVKALRREDYCFVIVGTPPDKGFADALRDRGENTLRLIADQPFDRLPGVTAAADLICLLQDPETEIAQYQLPAKVVDAISMGVPVLATDVPPLRKLIQSGAIEPVTRETLSGRIAWWLEATSEIRDAHRVRARGAFLRDFSYEAIHRTLFNEVEKCLAAPTSLPAAADEFLTAQARRYPSSDSKSDQGLDMVMFWKQGDVGLYGRRFDMFVRELSRRKEVRRIAVFDAPFSVYQVLRNHVPGTTVHHQDIAANKLVRRWGLLDEGKVSHHVFLFDNRAVLAEDRYPHGSRFLDFVAAELDGVGINPDKAVFWYYPVLDEIDALSARFKPRLKVVDIVDDQRTWPDRSEEDCADMTRHYRTVVEDADLVLANCETVRAAMSVYGRDVALVPNGCDTDPLPPNPESRLFSRFCNLPRPLLGLVGNLEGKTDLVLLERLVRERPDYQLVLIGSTHTNADILALDEYPNVHFFGIVTYPEVRVWVNHFDVALLPHLDTPQTRSMHPLKMLVYAAAGVRMVSTRIENLGEFEPFISLAEGHGAFIDAVDAAVAGTANGRSSEVADVVARNSWSQRVEEIMKRINASLVT